MRRIAILRALEESIGRPENRTLIDALTRWAREFTGYVAYGVGSSRQLHVEAGYLF